MFCYVHTYVQTVAICRNMVPATPVCLCAFCCSHNVPLCKQNAGSNLHRRLLPVLELLWLVGLLTLEPAMRQSVTEGCALWSKASHPMETDKAGSSVFPPRDCSQ